MSLMSAHCVAALLAASLVSVECFKGSPQFRALDLDITPRSDPTRNAIKLTTGVYRFSTKTASSTALVDLFSMVHIADPSYFETIKQTMEGYDIILYELITDNNNCDMAKGSDFKRQLNTEISAAETEKLASQYHLDSQVNLYNSMSTKGNSKSNWFIADLDSSEVMRLESPRRHLTLQSFRSSRFAGRAWEARLMKNFFLSDTSFITFLRYLSWLGPCPEFSCVLLDWSRWNQPTKAGGLPAVLLPIFEHISKGNIFAAKKLAFAQQLISGVPDSGAWGGEALSDVEVRVRARNAECCRVLKGFLDEHEQNAKNRLLKPIVTAPKKEQRVEDAIVTAEKARKAGELKVAILYGAYHIGDLTDKLKNMGLKVESVSSLTAWNMDSPAESSSSRRASSSPAAVTVAVGADGSGQAVKSVEPVTFSLKSLVKMVKTVRRPLLTVGVAGVCASYLALGALDWYLLIDYLVEITQSITSSVTIERGSAIIGFLQQLLELDPSLALTENDKIVELSFAVIYTVAYVQRHLLALRTASSVGIQWDRGLFEDFLED